MVTLTSRILGPDGQPIVLAELQEQQSSNIAWLHHSFQGHPSRGLTPSKLASIMTQAEQGDLQAQCELWEDIEERDAHIMSELGKRRRALLAIDWDIVPPANASGAEKRAARKLKELVDEIEDLEDLIYDVTDAIGKGYVGLEMPWHQVDGVWLPQRAIHREQSWLQIARVNGTEELRLRDGSQLGAPLRPFGWITHVHKAKSGYLGRSSLFRCLVWPYLFKNYAVGDLAEFLEIYGIPVRIGTYPSNSGEKEKATLLRALQSIGHNAAGIIPEGMVLDFKDAATGDPDAFIAMIEWCEKSQSKAILGGTLTSQADGKTSTNALGQVHNEVRQDLRDADARQIQRTLSRDLVYPIAVLNGLAADFRRCPRFRFDLKETEDVAAFATNLPPLVKLGFKINRQWAQEQVGIPEPEEGDEILGEPVAADPAVVDPKKKGAVAAATAITSSNVDGEAVDIATDQLMTAGEPIIANWFKVIGKELDKIAEQLEPDEVLDAVATRGGSLQSVLDLDDIAEAIAKALAVVTLAGRAAIADDVEAELSGVAVLTAQEGAGVINRGWQPAAEYFAQKVNLPTMSWRDLWQGQHARAFVVAGAMRDALLTDLREAVRAAVEDGISFETFRKNFEQLVSKNRWTGWTGENTERGRVWRARVIYRTNLATAHAAGRYRQMTDPAVLDHMPYWQYRHNTITNPREEHKSWDGLVLRWDDPWWQTHYPPNGWGCACDVRPLSERQLRKLGKSRPDTAPPPGDGDPPPEWAYNVGQAAWGKPVADSIVSNQRGAQMMLLDARGPIDFARGAMPYDQVGQLMRPDAADTGKALLRAALGGESRIIADPTGTRINVTEAGLANTFNLDYLQLLKGTLSEPFEVWASFAENVDTGRVDLRRRYVRAFAVQEADGRTRNVGLVADTVSGQWVGLSVFGAPEQARKGFLIWGRKP